MASPVVLVTGCSEGGMGFYIAKEYAKRGCRVYATARRLQAMAGLKGVVAEMLILDVTNKEQAQAVVQQVLAKEGRIDVLVNNAGLNTGDQNGIGIVHVTDRVLGNGGLDGQRLSLKGLMAVIDADLDACRGMFDTNFWGAINLCQLVGRHMAAQRSGHIVNIGSIASDVTTILNAFYCATKAALERATHALRVEMAPLGVKVTYVAPGMVATRIVAQPQVQASLQPSAWAASPLALLYAASASSLTRMLAGVKGGMPADVFAGKMVGALNVRRPPAVWRAGAMAWSYWLAVLLPTWAFDALQCTMMGMPKSIPPAGTAGSKKAE